MVYLYKFKRLVKVFVLYFLKVVIGGRNKYLINGCNANNTRVQDLFRSVQLNVNNPHFLIMQVRPVDLDAVFEVSLEPASDE